MADLENAVLATVLALADIPEPAKQIAQERHNQFKAKSAPCGFEEWLSYLVNARVLVTASVSPFSGLIWRNGSTPSASDINWLIDRLGKAIFAECALSLANLSGTEQSGTDVPPQFAFLSKLVARDSNLGRAHLFTLNYDTLLEQTLEVLGIQYFDGFSGRAEARFDPSVYGLDVYYPGELAEGRVRRFDKFLHLYKLHGSIHWHTADGELRARHPDLAPFKAYQGQSVTEKAVRLADIADSLPSVGILPTANKFAQTLSMPFAHLFRAFQIRLSAPQTFLLVLGYGFGDDHVTRIIETALMNPSLVLLVVEPNPASDTVKRIQAYKDLGKRAFILTPTPEAFKTEAFKNATFDDFAQTLMPDVQWLNDFLRLRRFEKQIEKSKPGADDAAGEA
ncbi:SIR2 family protein [uncultured Novosphingobium sp.]|uniref:SIR2 family protein n=1 Tax=uncultured Novosphingobium sp. TaxID=292277 RepID=UPI0025951420|nr:SIR2 family protein [uncultured Novosphingobium sp.]